ncbi:UvrD-helicase domain-containing protein [Methanobrevibacter woesei]|uniref:UvrD-helicase domain-containing protein n=1 Tax=Methanobrevibacter woesei TaxID=190976 RepID=UPI0039F5009A
MSIELNPEQKAAVTYLGPKPLLIEAGPGSGKTRVLIERIKFLLKQGVEPSSMLVITFTKKAAGELKERLNKENISQSVINEMQISTIHSFCLKILENENVHISNIFDEQDIIMYLSKYKKELGFNNEFFITNFYLKEVVDKYNEYLSFEVDTEGLCKYIKENHPYSEEYVNFVKYFFKKYHRFPKKEIKRNNFKNDWYNARYYKIAESYPRFLKILKENDIYTYDLLQKEALNYFNKNPDSQYINVLIDEFQDTDPIQMEIFKILIKNSMENNGSFTAVGDSDQKIYGFRGTTVDYFEYIRSNYDCEDKPLNVNYRSTDNIIEFSENFIKDQRSENSKKSIISDRKEIKDSYYFETSIDSKKKNEMRREEAINITYLINYLVKNKGINYSDIAILYRTVKTDSEYLVKSLEDNNIPFQISGIANLESKDEIQIILTLFYYIIDATKNVQTRNRWVDEWLNLETLANSKFMDFSEDTKEILKEKELEYNLNLLDVFKEEYRKTFEKETKIGTIKGIFGNDKISKEFIEELFHLVEKPSLNMETIEKWNITDKKDLEFFKKFNNIKKQVNDLPYYKLLNDKKQLEKTKEYYKDKFDLDEIPTILTVFYNLLELCGFTSQSDERYLKNLGRFSEILYRYEQVVSKYDVNGLFWYLSNCLSDYKSSIPENQAVLLSTIHKSKGLEFPVVIIPSINDTSIPKKFTDPREKKYKNGKGIYYTPSEFLKYKPNITIDEEKVEFDKEERRLFYVAVTRAKDLFILSVNIFKDKIPQLAEESIYDNNVKRLQREILPYMPEINSDEHKDHSKVNLSYSSLSSYQRCPLLYRFLYKDTFKQSDTDDIIYGLVIHELFNVINKKIKENGQIPDFEEIKKTAERLYLKRDFIRDPNDLTPIIESIATYFTNFGSKIKVLETEYKFNIQTDEYVLTGALDLLYETPDGKIGILDYKNSETSNYNISSYEKQLSTYILALKNDVKYKDITVDEAKIYTMKDSNLIDIKISNVDSYNLKIDKVANNIENNNFEPKENLYNCTNCKFRFFCNN